MSEKGETLQELMARRDAHEKRQRGNSMTIQRVHYRRISKAVTAMRLAIERECRGGARGRQHICSSCDLLARIDGDEL